MSQPLHAVGRPAAAPSSPPQAPADATLWTPLDVGPMRVRHRVMMTGHTLLYGADGVLSQRHIDYYAERAAGGAALLVTEQQAAHPSGANYRQGCRGYDPRAVAAYRKAADAVHAHGAKLLVQFFCGGAQGSGTMYIDEWRPLWAPSPVASTQFHEQPAEMTAADISAVVDGFALSAKHAAEAGCDGVEIHAAHSQLLGAFLSPAFNRRTDGYGGSTADRARIVLEIGAAVRAAVGPGFAVGLRLSIEERLANGAGITEAEFLRQLELFAAAGVFDFYDLSAGGYFAKHIAVTPMTSDLPAGFLAPAAARAKAVLPAAARVFIVGRILDVATASGIIASGAADMVGVTRAQMADPDFVAKARAGREGEITRCVGANVCIRRLGENNEIVCAVNPALGREAVWGRGTLRPAERPQRIGVIGAGPAGLRFAGTAARRGHSVTVFERRDAPGGRLRALASLPGRARWSDAIGNLVRPLAGDGVALRLREEADLADLERLGCEIAVAAIGARFDVSGYSAYRPERAGIPGAVAPRAIGIDEAIERAADDPAALGRRIVVVDDGYEDLAAGLAERLAADGGAGVHIVSPRPWWGESLYRTYDSAHVMPRLRRAGVTIAAQEFVDSIAGEIVTLYDVWNPAARRELAADTVVLALGRVVNQLGGRPGALPLRRIGDCVAPRAIEAVIYEGEEAARAA